MDRVVLLSGGFDPVHVGHLRMIQHASQYGDVVVALNSDEWLMRKKGYVFMPFEERREIIAGFRGVSAAVAVVDMDDTVCETIRMYRPWYFGNGGDRKGDNTPEVALCKELGVELLWNLGGGKIQSSSDLVKNAGLDK